MEISSTARPQLTANTVLRQTGDNNIRREPIRANADKAEQKTNYLVEVVDLRKLDENYRQSQKRTTLESMDFSTQKALRTYQNVNFQANTNPHIDYYV